MSEYDHQYTGTLPVLPVADVSNALACYVEQLGFEAVFTQPDDNGVLVNAQVQMDGCHIMLNLNPEAAGKGGAGVYFWVRVQQKPIDALYEQLLQQNIKPVEPIADQFWGDRSFVIKDADGYLIAFTQAIP